MATCVSYHGVNNIDVQFEDGFVLYHARWNQFVRWYASSYWKDLYKVNQNKVIICCLVYDSYHFLLKEDDGCFYYYKPRMLRGEREKL